MFLLLCKRLNSSVSLKSRSLEGKYASALFSAAKKSNGIDAINGSMNILGEILATNPKARERFIDPSVDKFAIFDAVKSTLDLSKQFLLENFFRLLVENGRVFLLPKIIHDWNELVKAHQGQIDVTITSAIVIGILFIYSQ